MLPAKHAVLALFLFSVFLWSPASSAFAAHGFAIYGEMTYPKTFKHFNWVNPNAPKQGILRQAFFVPFDSFNPYILSGNAPSGITLVHDTLMKTSMDEPFTSYGLIAEDVVLTHDSITFTLRDTARFHDGTQISAKDVLFSFSALRDKGIPVYRYYYTMVTKADILSDRQIRFHADFKSTRDLATMIGQLPVFPAHLYDLDTFDTPSLTIPVGSGPYRVSSFDGGKSLTLSRVKDYWGKDLPVNVGFYNFDTLQYDLYRDTSVVVEALKADKLDVRYENESRKWAKAYPDTLTHLKKATFANELPAAMQAFAFNIRRDKFKNPNVRKAIGYAFDFEWINKNIFYGLYQRVTSYFDNSTLADPDRPALPATQGDGDNRANLKTALAILTGEGFYLKDGLLHDPSTGKPFTFEILLDAAQGSVWERVCIPFVQNLRKIGITATVRTLEANQYRTVTDTFDYDMVTVIFAQSLAPGKDMAYTFGSVSADQKGSRNAIGLKSDMLDRLIDRLAEAQTLEELVARARAVDRALLSGFYVIPHWYSPYRRYVLRDHVMYPEKTPMLGEDLTSWWTIRK